jgi:predicted P-loop ATPase
MKNIELIETYLNNKSVFRYNTVSMRTEYRQINEENYYPLDERKLKSLFRELNKNNLTVAKNNLECLLSSDYAEIYNPFTDYFDKLPAVEGTKNIDLFCLTLKTHDDQLFKWAFTKWIVAMVGNMIDENVINHQCIVLSGSQGIGKSTWVRNLLPNKLKPYYHEGNIKLGDKDSLKNISTKCLINLDELAGMTSKQSPMLKELITKSNTELRKAYAHLDEFFVRRASFIGSINGGEFLYDLTGNRRFLCFEVDWFENTGNHNMNMDLIFAEAYHLFKNGFQYWFNHEDQIKVEENNKQFYFNST